MRLTIVTAGSRGDAQPYVALGLGLREAGHEVKIAGDPEFEALATKHGLEFAALPLDGRAAFSQCPESLDNPAAMLRWLKAHYTPDRAYFAALLAALRGSDAALGGVPRLPCGARRRSARHPVDWRLPPAVDALARIQLDLARGAAALDSRADQG